MIDSYEKCVNYLNNIPKYTAMAGVYNCRTLLDELGSPEKPQNHPCCWDKWQRLCLCLPFQCINRLENAPAFSLHHILKISENVSG